MKRPYENKQNHRSCVIRTCVCVFLCLVSLLPFYLLFINATRTSNAIRAGVSLFPGANLSNNLTQLNIKQQGLGITILGSMLNSFVIAVPATLLSVYFSSMTAYGIHIYSFRLKNAAWTFIMAVMMVPSQVVAIGFYKFMLQIGLMDTYWPLILPWIATPTVVFFMRQYLQGSLPVEMVEAARIDGSSELGTFNRIVVPLMKPAIATQAIFQFVASWNNLFLPSMIITTTGKKTLPMFVQMLNSDAFKTDYGIVYLGLALTILPLFIVYFVLSKFIVEGVTIGGVKE